MQLSDVLGYVEYEIKLEQEPHEAETNEQRLERVKVQIENTLKENDMFIAHDQPKDDCMYVLGLNQHPFTEIPIETIT